MKELRCRHRRHLSRPCRTARLPRCRRRVSMISTSNSHPIRLRRPRWRPPADWQTRTDHRRRCSPRLRPRQQPYPTHSLLRRSRRATWLLPRPQPSCVPTPRPRRRTPPRRPHRRTLRLLSNSSNSSSSPMARHRPRLSTGTHRRTGNNRSSLMDSSHPRLRRLLRRLRRADMSSCSGPTAIVIQRRFISSPMASASSCSPMGSNTGSSCASSRPPERSLRVP